MFEIPGNYIMPFGKHEGTEISKVPAKYLIYLFEHNMCYSETRQYIKENIVRLKKQAGK